MNSYKNFNLLLVVVLVLVGGFVSFVPKVHADAINAATQAGTTTSTQYTAFKGVPVYRLVVTNSGGTSDTITSLSPTPSGSVVDTLIRLHFYHDVNNNGIVEEGDTDLGASALFGADDTQQTFNIADVTVPAYGSASILITADGTGLATPNFFILSFPAAVDITTATPITSGAPGAGSTLTVTNTAPSLTIANGAQDPIAKTATASETGVIVKQLSITTAAAGTSDSIVSLAITPGGSEDAINISSTKFYIDLGTPGVIVDGVDILLEKTPETYTDNTKKVFTFTSPIQIEGGTSVKILYTYDLGAGVVGGRTLTAQLVGPGDAVAGSGVTVTTNDSTVSDTITIADTAIIAVGPSKITGPNKITVVFVPGTGPMVAAPITAFGAGALALTSGGTRSITNLDILTSTTAVYTFDGAAVALNETATLTVTTPTNITDTGGNTFNGAGYPSFPITDGQAPVVTSVLITAGAYKIGSVISVTITTSADADIYTAGAITINGHTMGSFASAGANTYTGTYTVISGDLDRASVGAIPISVVLTDTATFHNSNVAYTTAPTSGGTVTIDTTVPTLTSAIFTNNDLKVGENSLVTFTFSEPITGFTNADLTIPHGGLTVVGSDDGGTTWTATFTPTASIEFPTNAIIVAMTGIVDIAGNAGTGTTNSSNYDIDTLAPSTPTATPTAGTYTSAQSVTLSSDVPDNIMYSTDGSDPSLAICFTGIHFVNPIPVTSSMTIKAVACDDAGNKSPLGTFVYTINIPPSNPSTPTATPTAGTYTSAQTVALTSEGSTSIMYSTTDDYDPSADFCDTAPKYSGPIPVTSSLTIRAVGCDDAGNKSPMGTFVYTINIPSSSHTSSGGYLPGYGPRANIIPIVSVAPVINPTITLSSSNSILGSGKCSQELIITDNMKKGNRNGVYSEYNKGTVKQVAILQAHINRILAGVYKEAAGPIDGIYGKLTKQGVERLQKVINNLHQSDKSLIIDGIIGSYTKEAINNSCGNN